MNNDKPKFDFNSISISPKEFISALLFVLTMSSVWYKLSYGSNANTNDILELKEDIKELKGKVIQLERAEIIRKTREESANK